MKITYERIGEFEDRTVEITQSEKQGKLDFKEEGRKERREGGRKGERKDRASATCETITKDLTFMSLESQVEGKEVELKKHSKK